MSDNHKKKIYFITGGGTGGHIYPAIAVADGLNSDSEVEKIYYVGNPNNLEFDIVKKKGYEFLPVNISGMPRKLNFSLVKWGVQLILAVIKCLGYIKKYKPDGVFGTGGYVSAPILIASQLTKTPYMMHDCDAQPGLVTRKLSKGAAAVSLAFDCAVKSINNEKYYINGNPIRPEFKTLSRNQARQNLGLGDKMTICVMGGSQGARSINDATVSILKTISQKYDFQVIFQTGKKNFSDVIEKLLKVYPEYTKDKNLIVKPYFDDMVTVLKASDIAVSRSGSLSLSEICASGVASVLVPYPYAAADHQRKNAKFLTEKGAALYLEDNEVSEKTLFNAILSLATDLDKLIKVQNNALNLAKYDGVEKIINQLKAI